MEQQELCLVVDRVEQGIAVCEQADGTQIRLPLKDFPGPVREGEHYRRRNGSWQRDPTAEEAARRRNQALQRSLFEP